MHPAQGHDPKVLTCRYWAYGYNGCPDREEDCRFAHRDTGMLSMYKDQKGTCWKWKYSGTCVRGPHCDFEHRETGVAGSNKGRLMLFGVDFEIARAAQLSGFDCTNHSLLLDLIWACRRAAGHHMSKFAPASQPRPPRDPLYPDRWRPGDKRKRSTSPGTINLSRGGGSKEHPIDLDDDQENRPTPANSGAKRQKTQFPHGPNRNRIPLGPRSTNAHHPPSYNPPKPLGGPTPLHADRTKAMLHKIINTLSENSRATLACVDALSQLWNEDRRMRYTDVVEHLLRLKVDLQACDGGAFHGMQKVRDVITLLNDEVL